MSRPSFPPSAAHEVSCALGARDVIALEGIHPLFVSQGDEARGSIVAVLPLAAGRPLVAAFCSSWGEGELEKRELCEWPNRQTDLKSYRAGDQPTRSPCRPRIPNGIACCCRDFVVIVVCIQIFPGIRKSGCELAMASNRHFSLSLTAEVVKTPPIQTPQFRAFLRVAGTAHHALVRTRAEKDCDPSLSWLWARRKRSWHKSPAVSPLALHQCHQ